MLIAPMTPGLRGLHRIELVVQRGGRAGEVVDLVHLHVQREGDVVPQQLEGRMRQEVLDVAPCAGEEVIDAKDFAALGQQPLAQVGPEEAGSAGDQDTLAQRVGFHSTPAGEKKAQTLRYMRGPGLGCNPLCPSRPFLPGRLERARGLL
jgi:hypothetical protein